jgi:hypothetical protein
VSGIGERELQQKSEMLCNGRQIRWFAASEGGKKKNRNEEMEGKKTKDSFFF